MRVAVGSQWREQGLALNSFWRIISNRRPRKALNARESIRRRKPLCLAQQTIDVRSLQELATENDGP
jgi:hypothetical protein